MEIPYFIAFMAAFVLLPIVGTAQSKISAPTDAIQEVNTDKSGITIETRIAVEQEGEKTKIIFWQNTENGFIFKKVNWKGDVTLLLDNGESIVLKDANMKGNTIERASVIAGFYVPDLYERYASYYLTENDCSLLKKHSILLISYHLDDKYDKQLHHIEISDKSQSLKSQLAAIGK